MSGWIRVARNVFDHGVFAHEPFSEREAWLWLVAKAAWKDTDIQVETTGEALRKAWSWNSRSRVARVLRRLEAEGFLSVKEQDKSILIIMQKNSSMFEVVDEGGVGRTFFYGRRMRPMPPFRVFPADWAARRDFVFQRDGYRCSYCGSDNGPFECDHVTPVIRGGSDDIKNLATACQPCNRSKGAKSLEEWRR